MENNNQNVKKETNRKEKKVIIYIITIALILLFISIFFVHDIVDRVGEKSNSSSTVSIVIKAKTDENNEEDNNAQAPENNEQNAEIVDYADRILVKEGNVNFEELKELNIFNNSYFKDEALIAPGVQGKYNFVVVNETPANFKYNINFEEVNQYGVNMVFKIKRNGEYIAGNEDTWLDKGTIDFLNYKLNAKTEDLYTVEWKWEDAENDTTVGETTGANYKLNVKVTATQEV